jgi:hypothetical protein
MKTKFFKRCEYSGAARFFPQGPTKENKYEWIQIKHIHSSHKEVQGNLIKTIMNNSMSYLPDFEYESNRRRNLQTSISQFTIV